MKIEKVSKKDRGLYVNAPRMRARENEKFERTTVQIPTATMRRFEERTKGSKGLCFQFLIEYAMDTLEKNGEIIVIN
jgi:hypothetical protein